MAYVDSSGYSYGTAAYGSNSFGVDDLQTVATASASASSGCVRVRLSGSLVSSNSTIAAVGGRTTNASASITATSSASCGATQVFQSDAATTSTATTTATAQAIRSSGALISSTASTSSIGEEFVLRVISAYDYGTGAYGGGYFGEGPLDTIASSSASTTSDATRVRIASASISVTSSTSSAAVTVVDGEATVSATATNTCIAAISVVGAASGSATATATATCIRRRKSGALISSTSSIASIAREKWEPITAGAQNWVTISTSIDTWTKVA